MLLGGFPIGNASIRKPFKNTCTHRKPVVGGSGMPSTVQETPYTRVIDHFVEGMLPKLPEGKTGNDLVSSLGKFLMNRREGGPASIYPLIMSENNERIIDDFCAKHPEYNNMAILEVIKRARELGVSLSMQLISYKDDALSPSNSDAVARAEVQNSLGRCSDLPPLFGAVQLAEAFWTFTFNGKPGSFAAAVCRESDVETHIANFCKELHIDPESLKATGKHGKSASIDALEIKDPEVYVQAIRKAVLNAKIVATARGSDGAVIKALRLALIDNLSGKLPGHIAATTVMLRLQEFLIADNSRNGGHQAFEMGSALKAFVIREFSLNSQLIRHLPDEALDTIFGENGRKAIRTMGGADYKLKELVLELSPNKQKILSSRIRETVIEKFLSENNIPDEKGACRKAVLDSLDAARRIANAQAEANNAKRPTAAPQQQGRKILMPR